MKNLFIIILLFISLCLTAQSVPQTIDYQGRLADSDGNYLNSVVTVDFLIYDTETGGTEMWNETQDVNCVNGIFHVQLGSTVSFPTDLFDSADRWLELIVGGEILSPRTAIASVPYSLKAEDADLLDGLNSSNFALSAHNHSAYNITSGVLDASRYSSYSDLSAEGYLSNNSSYDLLTRDQGDTRWINTTGDTMTGDLVVNADFQTTGITYDSDGDAGTSGQIFSSTTSGTDWIDTAATSTLYIGQSYGGGIIFWLDASGQHGLIAATADQNSNIQWSSFTSSETGATLSAVFAGKANTDMIISVQVYGYDAAQVCNDYSITIDNEYYDDWYLPSKYELNLMYLHKAAIGGFANGYYWSSTEIFTVQAFVQDFPSGYQNIRDKDYFHCVRAIRAF